MDQTETIKEETLRELFDRLGIRPSRVAKKMQMSRQSVYLWLAGKTVPKPWTRMELSLAIGVPDGVVRRAIEVTREQIA